MRFRQQGRSAQDKGDFRQALFYYIRAVAFNPYDAALQNDLGLMYEQSGQMEDAQKAYYKAIELDSHYLPAYSNLGLFFKGRGQDELAAMYLRDRIVLGTSSDPWVLTAQEALEDIYRRSPQLKNARILEASLAQEEKVARHRSAVKRLASRRKEMSYEVALQDGLNAFKDGDMREAVRSFEEALKLQPDSAEALHALERAKGRMQHAEVKRTLDASLRENRKHIISRYLMEQQSQSNTSQR